MHLSKAVELARTVRGRLSCSSNTNSKSWVQKKTKWTTTCSGCCDLRELYAQISGKLFELLLDSLYYRAFFLLN